MGITEKLLVFFTLSFFVLVSLSQPDLVSANGHEDETMHPKEKPSSEDQGGNMSSYDRLGTTVSGMTAGGGGRTGASTYGGASSGSASKSAADTSNIGSILPAYTAANTISNQMSHASTTNQSQLMGARTAMVALLVLALHSVGL